jgi:hypothetical protein
MPDLDRSCFLVATAATAATGLTRRLSRFATPQIHRILTLVYDKALGAMRAVDRLVP